MIPGEWLLSDDPIEINPGRRTLRISVRNTGDRAIQIGSLEATADLPVNVGLLAKGNSSRPESLVEQLRAGACGLKVHDDWGATPAAISAFVSRCCAAGTSGPPLPLPFP